MFKLLSNEGNDKKFKIKQHNLDDYFKFDSSSIDSLKLVSDRMGQSTLKTIYGLFNQCSTSQGQRLLMQWIRQPLVDVNKISLIFFLINTLKK